MSHKILKYHRDHNASLEEAKVIANYYNEKANEVSQAKTKQDLVQLITNLKTLSAKISRYHHRKRKYNWSKSLNKIILKLEKIE